MENNIRFQNENEFIVVAVPYRTDAPELWDRLGVPKDVSVATFAKIEERGVVFASRIFRDDERDGEGHDYFSYSHKLVKDGIVKDIEEGLTRGAKHEGSHYLIDALVCHLLDIGDANPAYESVAELVSNGQRIHVSTSVPFDVIIEDPYMEKHDFTRLSANYHAAPKVLLSLVNITAQENKIDYEVALVSVMAAALRTAIEMNASETLNFMNSNQRVSSFFRGLASELNISYEQLQTEYQAVNGSGEESV